MRKGGFFCVDIKGFRWRWLDMAQFIGREKAGQMPGAAGTQVAPNLAGNSSELSGIVISTGNQVGAGFDMNPKRVRSLGWMESFW